MAQDTDHALAVTTEESAELATSQATAMARHEIEGAIVLARRFPRNEDEAYGRVMKACDRWSFASVALYSYPRGGQQIEGPSVNLAREIARCWGNIRCGADIVHDDDKSRTVRGWAWDIESNTKETQDATFRKLVYRKKGGWVTPDERDLRELTNKQSAICVRNCLLHLFPPDLIEEARTAAKAAMEKGVAQDVDGHRKRIIKAFGGIGVAVADLEAHLGHPLKQAAPAEVADLRNIYKSIADGNSVWADYVQEPPDAMAEKLNAAAMPTGRHGTQARAEPVATDDDEPIRQDEQGLMLQEYIDLLASCTSLIEIKNTVKLHARDNPALTEATRQKVISKAEMREVEIRAARGAASNEA